MRYRSKKREWIVIITIVVLLHLVLFLSIKSSFFEAFKKTISPTAGSGAGRPSVPDAIVMVPIDVETEDEPIDPQPITPLSPKNPSERPTEEVPDTPPSDEDLQDVGNDVSNLLGDSPRTMPSSGTGGGVAIPPRPVEITWPDTRRLKHCLGHQINLRIEVSDTGEILQVKPLDLDHPLDCIRAAVESASSIVFEPGSVDGKPATLWTQIRIDFRKKN